jgi:phage gp16-like protein
MTAPAFQRSDRQALTAKIHIGAKELGLDEETRRDVMSKVTGGVRSSKDCTDAQLIMVLAHYRSLGWSPAGAAKAPVARKAAAPRSDRNPAKHPVARKARALWISLHQLGAVRDPSERALEAFGKRQLGVDRLQWADQGQGHRLIEALKAMAERAGWSQDLQGIKPDSQVRALKCRLVNRQLEILGRPFLMSVGMSERDLDVMARELAAEIPRPAE